jgi:hypothetical protein
MSKKQDIQIGNKLVFVKPVAVKQSVWATGEYIFLFPSGTGGDMNNLFIPMPKYNHGDTCEVLTEPYKQSSVAGKFVDIRLNGTDYTTFYMELLARTKLL